MVAFIEHLDQEQKANICFALANPVLADMLRLMHSDQALFDDGISVYGPVEQGGQPQFLLPRSWQVGLIIKARRFDDDLDLSPFSATAYRWLVIANGRYAAFANRRLLARILSNTKASVVAIQTEPALLGYHERTVELDPRKVVGFRRFYEDGLEPVEMPDHWPDYLLIRKDCLNGLFDTGRLKRDFSIIKDRLAKYGDAICYRLAGLRYELTSEDGLLGFFSQMARYYDHVPAGWGLVKGPVRYKDTGRVFGKVWIGPGVWLGQDSVVVGPSILGNCARLEQHSSVVNAIIGPNTVVDQQSCIRHRIVTYRSSDGREDRWHGRIGWLSSDERYIRWPWYAYPRLPKRILDVAIASILLILFAPVMLVIAIAIKLDSPGPVFFRDPREGRYGRPFMCLKFRSMKIGSEQIQECLRRMSEVDGPQFKMADDPRITRVGRFLRETYLDEVPQFLNVLFGHMSIVGPRPSPRAENTLCPYWRYNRLSVRPGVTGLWQIKRTRQPGRDFQEWIEYDTRYVRQLGLWLDVKICCRTLGRMMGKFAGQF